MKISQIANTQQSRDFGAPDYLCVETKEQVEKLVRESIRDTREGYTIAEVKASLARSRERALA